MNTRVEQFSLAQFVVVNRVQDQIDHFRRQGENHPENKDMTAKRYLVPIWDGKEVENRFPPETELGTVHGNTERSDFIAPSADDFAKNALNKIL